MQGTKREIPKRLDGIIRTDRRRVKERRRPGLGVIIFSLFIRPTIQQGTRGIKFISRVHATTHPMITLLIITTTTNTTTAANLLNFENRRKENSVYRDEETQSAGKQNKSYRLI